MANGNESNGRLSAECLPAEATNTANNAVHEHERFRLLAFAGLTLVLIGLCVALAVPFLPAITWSIALAIIAWPMHRWIGNHVSRPVVASLLSTATVVILIVAPALFVTYQLTREAVAVAEQAQDKQGKSAVREKIVAVPVLGEVANWMDRMGVEVEGEIRKFIGAYVQDAAGIVQGSFAAIIQFLVTVFILYFLFHDRGGFLRGLRGLLPMSRTECDKVFQHAADSVHANLYATLITSLIDASGGALLFWALGLPAPLLWGAVMFVLSLLPIVGAALVWFPAVVFLALTEHWLESMILLGWGVISFIIVDNIIYVRLVGQRMRMHEAPALIAFLGGIAVFGISGMILGPAILAVTMAFLEVWKWRWNNDGADAPPVKDTSRQSAGVA